MINTGQIAQLLRPGLKAVFGDYGTYPAQWKDIFNEALARRVNNHCRSFGVALNACVVPAAGITITVLR